MSEVAPRLTSAELAARWLGSLRWNAVSGQTLAVLVARYVFELPLPMPALASLIAITALSNLLTLPVTIVLVLDVALLTGMLYLSGGAHNPFVVLYLLHIALGTFVLKPKQASLVALASLSGYAALLLSKPAFSFPDALFQSGMTAVIGIASVFTFIFVSRLSVSLRKHEEALHKTQTLASLGAFAADAAHELGSPLGTIAVAANDLPGDDGVLIRDEIDRCQRILQRMHHRAGQMLGEVSERMAASAIASSVLAELKHEAEGRIEVRIDRDVDIACPQIALHAALSNVLKNALEASSEKVVLAVKGDDQRCTFQVADRGCGISCEDLEQIGQPFFTTKHGMGLGLFLSNAFAERAGGRLTIDSTVGRGTTVTLELPRG